MGNTVSANQSIFAQLSAPRTTRLVSTPNGTLSLYSNMAIGTVSGEQRTIEAAMAEYVGQGDHWAIVNLFDGNGYVSTVAVLGANSLDQAGEWALRQYGDVNGAIRYTLATAHYDTLKRYLDRTPYKAEITQKSLDVVASKITNTPIVWSDSKLMSHGGSSLNLLLDLVKTDFDSDMVRPMTTTDLLMGSDIAEYDALIVQYGKLDMMMNRLTAAMGKAAIGGLTVTDVQQTKPFKKDNATNVASVFTLSDGQTLSIIFHNPDATPKKLSTTDDVVSWKWLLNKRDVSAAVQPEQGKDVQLPALAVRMLKVANANSKRFKATAAKRNENEVKLTELQARMTDKGNLSTALDATIADLQSQIDARAQGAVSEPKVPPIGFEGVWDSEDGSKYPFLSVRKTGIASFATREEAEAHYQANTQPESPETVEPQPTEPVAAPAQTASDTQPTEDADLVYWKDSKGFVEFLPVTKSGESAWNQIASQWKDAWQKAFPDMDVRANAIAPEKDLAKVLKSLRGAGYTVRARRKGETFVPDEISNMSDDELLSELDLPQPTENPDMTYLQSIIDGVNQGTDKDSRAKVREILVTAKAEKNTDLEALATEAVQQIAARVKAAAQAKLAEVA